MRLGNATRYGYRRQRPASGSHEVIDAVALFEARGSKPMSKLDELKSRTNGGMVIEATRRFQPDYDPAAAKDISGAITSSPSADFDKRTGQGKLL